MERRAIEVRLADAGFPPLPRLAWLEIDVDALAGNLAAVRRLAGPGVRVEPVVKADAYGHGAVPVARRLEDAGADGLCVAAVDEAIELRRGGVRLPILVLYPVPAAYVAAAAQARIAISTGGGRGLEQVLEAAAARAARGRRALVVHLEVDTGLGRGGVVGDDAATAAAAIRATRGVRLGGLWTHLQAAEDPRRTGLQMKRFAAAADRLSAAGIPLPRRHVAASGMLLSGMVVAHDAVRPGLSIYGIVPEELGPSPEDRAAAAGLRPVLSLHARPVRVVDLPSGSGIGYGPTFVTIRPSRIATLPLGYGDGWSRALSNRAEALVRGRRAPIVGNVSMDGITVDVTDVPGRPVDEDDEFVLIGRQGAERISVLDVAQRRTTNTWEVVTAMARRLPRVYHAASEAVEVRSLASGDRLWRALNSGTATSATWRSTRS
ncbi:MAG: alanine racemase [Chloroflexota bacterium]